MIPEANDPVLIGCAIGAVAVVYGALWILGYVLNALWDWRARRTAARKPRPSILWVTATDPRTRHLAEAFKPVPWDEAEPPRDLGRFDCAGRYRFPSPPKGTEP